MGFWSAALSATLPEQIYMSPTLRSTVNRSKFQAKHARTILHDAAQFETLYDKFFTLRCILSCSVSALSTLGKQVVPACANERSGAQVQL